MLPQKIISRICTSCGLCCSGVLFSDVELTAKDEAQKLAGQNVTLKRRGSKTKLMQPCTAWVSGKCTVYEIRPCQCRAFECRLLQLVGAGEVTEERALKRIQSTVKQVDLVKRLVRALGDAEEGEALAKRYRRILSQPEDLAATGEVSRMRGKLLMAVHRLMEKLEAHFL